jgi:hypothetical protein
MLKSGYHGAIPLQTDIHLNTELRLVTHGQLSPYPAEGQADVRDMITAYCESRRKHTIHSVALRRIFNEISSGTLNIK